jgi:anti-sigma regulatory factor (Ser/Thr protein kinase)
VARLNLYHQALRADDMTTLIYAVIEPDQGRLRLVNAGHPPPALVVPGASARLLEGSCPALGIAEICRAPEIVVDFPPGATLALYTDGLVERRHEGIDTGLARLLSALAGAPGDVDAVRDDVIEACLGPERVDDDVTALFVRAEQALGETVRLTLTPDPDALAAMRRMLRRWLIEMGAAPDEMAGIVMAANEAWQNALEHGTNFARTTVGVDLEADPHGEVSITVRDAGSRDRAPSDPDRGRGIELMRALADEVTLELAPHGSTVRLRRQLRAPARSAADGLEADRVADGEARV